MDKNLIYTTGPLIKENTESRKMLQHVPRTLAMIRVSPAVARYISIKGWLINMEQIPTCVAKFFRNFDVIVKETSTALKVQYMKQVLSHFSLTSNTRSIGCYENVRRR